MDFSEVTLFTTFSIEHPETPVFLFQLMFCGTAATIVLRAVAERMKFGAYLIVTAPHLVDDIPDIRSLGLGKNLGEWSILIIGWVKWDLSILPVQR